jgi:transcriptional regulator with XRE-family HTH domain
MFAKKLKELREAAGMTQQELAEKIGMKRASVAAYEASGQEPKYDILQKLAGVFSCSTDYLLGRSNIRDAGEYAALQDDPELLEFWEQINANPDMQLMYKKAKNLTPDALRQIIKIIKTFEEE